MGVPAGRRIQVQTGCVARIREAVQSGLNRLGSEGWELVSTFQSFLALFGTGGDYGRTYVFKRHKVRDGETEQTRCTGSPGLAQ